MLILWYFVNMKKIYLISAVTIIFVLLFTLKTDWFGFFWVKQIYLWYLISGIFMVLVQNEDRSYQFLSKLIIGSILTSFIGIILFQIFINQFSWLYILSALSFMVVSIFGGLIGIVIKVLNKSKKI